MSLGDCVTSCQSCGSSQLLNVVSLGDMPAVNRLEATSSFLEQEKRFPTELAICAVCSLAQLKFIAPRSEVFPDDYPYTSGTTKALHRNFEGLYEIVSLLTPLDGDEFIIDIGSNDGTLLSKFQKFGHKVLGIEPTGASALARASGIPTEKLFFSRSAGAALVKRFGPAKVVCCTNCLAHVPDVGDFLGGVTDLLDSDGIFVSESHYFFALIKDLQFDTIYHEHLRYYSVRSLQMLFSSCGLDVFHVQRIPTHGGSIRVFACLAGRRPILNSVHELLESEPKGPDLQGELDAFQAKVSAVRGQFNELISPIIENGATIVGIGAPSRSAILVNFFSVSRETLNYIAEAEGSRKIGKFLPGTNIQIVEETRVYEEQPEYALILAWHLATEIATSMRAKGFSGSFLVPLPVPTVLDI